MWHTDAHVAHLTSTAVFAACLSALSLAGVWWGVLQSCERRPWYRVGYDAAHTPVENNKRIHCTQAVIQPLNQQLEYIGSIVWWPSTASCWWWLSYSAPFFIPSWHECISRVIPWKANKQSSRAACWYSQQRAGPISLFVTAPSVVLPLLDRFVCRGVSCLSALLESWTHVITDVLSNCSTNSSTNSEQCCLLLCATLQWLEQPTWTRSQWTCSVWLVCHVCTVCAQLVVFQHVAYCILVVVLVTLCSHIALV